MALQQKCYVSQNMLVMLVNVCYISGKHCISPEIGNRTRLNIFWKLWNKYSGTIHIIPKWSHDMAGIFVYMFIKKILFHRNILQSVYSKVLAKCFFITQVGKRGLKVILISVARETNNILTCHSPRLRGEINVAKQGRVPLRFLLGSLMAPVQHRYRSG